LLGIQAALLEKGYMMIVGNTGNDVDVHRTIIAGMIDRQVDGLILATVTLHDPIVEEWIERGAPLILINRTDETGRAAAVVNDDLRGIALAVEHVAALGHTRIGHIAGPQWLSTGLARYRGFKFAIAERNLPNQPRLEVTAVAFSREAGRTSCHELLDRNSEITAIIAANDLLALGCYDALAERGLVCPGDISVTGYNDAPFVDMVMPPLTTVRIQQRQMGTEAARLLLTKIENPTSEPVDILLRPTLVIRRSTAPPSSHTC
jgi:LacI family transcriptional regulator